MERWVSNRRGSSPCRSTWQTGRQISNCRGLEGGVWSGLAKVGRERWSWRSVHTSTRYLRIAKYYLPIDNGENLGGLKLLNYLPLRQ